MLEAVWEGGGALALNDAFVGRSGPPKLLTLKVEINGEHMDTYQADGVLVATPTGSTAYNLSAGGPVIKPDADILAITPVCPHALHARGAVISAADEVAVSVLSHDGVELFMDGEPAAKLPQGERVIIKRSIYNTTIIKTTGSSFYGILRQKMI
jgi:NAD+ kinase